MAEFDARQRSLSFSDSAFKSLTTNVVIGSRFGTRLDCRLKHAGMTKCGLSSPVTSKLRGGSIAVIETTEALTAVPITVSGREFNMAGGCRYFFLRPLG